MAQPVIVDLRNIYSSEEVCRAKFRYICIGNAEAPGVRPGRDVRPRRPAPSHDRISSADRQSIRSRRPQSRVTRFNRSPFSPIAAGFAPRKCEQKRGDQTEPDDKSQYLVRYPGAKTVIAANTHSQRFNKKTRATTSRTENPRSVPS